MLDSAPRDILNNVFQYLNADELTPCIHVCKTLQLAVMDHLTARANTIGSNTIIIDNVLAKLPIFSAEYDAVLEATRQSALAIKAQLLQSYPDSPNFFSRETETESLESYDPSVLLRTPTIQFIRLRVDSIICNIAVTRRCMGVQLVVENQRIFQYSKDILDLYPTVASGQCDDAFINLGPVFQEFPIKAMSIYILFEFPATMSKDVCMSHIRLDMMHPPYPFLNLYHMLDVPIDSIRHAYLRAGGGIFNTDFGHVTGIIFDHPLPIHAKDEPLVYMIEGVEFSPHALPLLNPDSSPRAARVLRFDRARALPIQINVFPASCRPAIYFLTTNILYLLMNWQLQCS